MDIRFVGRGIYPRLLALWRCPQDPTIRGKERVLIQGRTKVNSSLLLGGLESSRPARDSEPIAWTGAVTPRGVVMGPVWVLDIAGGFSTRLRERGLGTKLRFIRFYWS
jgi:hypothetical protein